MILHASPLLMLAAESDFVSSWCGGPQSSLDPAGPQAGRISGLWWEFFSVSGVVYAIVMLVLIGAVAIRGRRTFTPPILQPPPFWESIRAWIIGGAILATTVILFFVLISDHIVGRDLRNFPTENAVKIRATGHQWWWEFRFEDSTPSNIFTTANEIHIPVGRPIEFELQSPDVIHSFWIPNLHGKRDMIPGHPTRTILQADKAGTYWGQCAEFCGYQHAKMRFKVVAEPDADYQKWLAASRQPAAEPTTDSQKKGRAIFLGRSCVMCHTIEGTIAGAMVGPELTHLASRSKIAAGSLPNTRGYLAGWVANPQQIKPGVRMPPNPLPPNDLQALLDYLESLK
jgi:cytochrome c oxidase subunit 2